MDIKALLIFLAISCSLIIQAESHLQVFHKNKIKDNNVFKPLEIDTYELLRSSKLQKLNDLLVDRTESVDPDVNLDIVLEELIKDYKNLAQTHGKTLEAKRLILALSTINDENECSMSSYLIHKKNFDALGTTVRSINTNTGLRRIDKILAHYIKRHVNKCRDVHFTNLDYFLYNDNQNNDKLKSVDILVKPKIEALISDENPENKDKTYVERLYRAITEGTSSLFEILPKDIYKAMKVLIKGDPDEAFLRPVENEKTGSFNVKEDKFKRLYFKYVVEPCNYYRQQVGPSIFEPALFYSLFDHQTVRTDRADYYEFWLKYRICAEVDEPVNRVLHYANSVR